MDGDDNRPNLLIVGDTVVRILLAQEGINKSGDAWRKDVFVTEAEAQYLRAICLNIRNNRIDEFPLTESDLVEVRFDVESREYTERWYINVATYSVSEVSQTVAAISEADPFADRAPYIESVAPSTGSASQAPEADAQNQFGGSFGPAAGDNADDLSS